jgi:hypothetical protein
VSIFNWFGHKIPGDPAPSANCNAQVCTSVYVYVLCALCVRFLNDLCVIRVCFLLSALCVLCVCALCVLFVCAFCVCFVCVLCVSFVCALCVCFVCVCSVCVLSVGALCAYSVWAESADMCALCMRICSCVHVSTQGDHSETCGTSLSLMKRLMYVKGGMYGNSVWCVELEFTDGVS